MCPKSIAPFDYVDKPTPLARLTARIRKAKRVALDTEADSLFHYFEKVCLIQLSINDSNFIVDPLAEDLDLEAFLKALASKPLLIHGADYDLRMMRASFDFHPESQVFDTMLAAQLLGYDQLGLAALVERIVGVTLCKDNKKSDWSRRPLSSSQLEYACDDTRFLETIAQVLGSELKKLRRTAWHQETCSTMIQATCRDKSPPDPDDQWRIKGLRELKSKQLAFVRELWKWREVQARAVDRPPFKIMGNRQIIDLAVRAAGRRSWVPRNGQGVPRNCRGRRLESLVKAIERARALPQSRWPSHKKGRKPNHECSREMEALSAATKQVAEGLGLAPSILAPRATLRTIALNRPRNVDEIMGCSSMMHWQAELLAAAFHEALEKI